MTTVAVQPPARKAPKAFCANLYDEAGVLAKVESDLVFFGDDGAITTVEPADINFLVVLGEVGISDTQRIMDVVVHGGYATVCTSRPMLEV